MDNQVQVAVTQSESQEKVAAYLTKNNRWPFMQTIGGWNSM